MITVLERRFEGAILCSDLIQPNLRVARSEATWLAVTRRLVITNGSKIWALYESPTTRSKPAI